jgi:hypothetical protein
MEQGFRVSQAMLAIVQVLEDVLGAVVALLDADTALAHSSTKNGRWLSFPSNGSELEPTPGTIATPINKRWWLCVSPGDSLRPGAELLCAWAADKLARRLPARSHATV